MKWKDIFSEKGNRGLLLASVIMILVMLVMIRQENKNQVSELQKSLTSIYEDRLVAKSYLFELTKKIHSKKIMAELVDEFLKQNIQMNDAIQQLIKSYENTELTKEEELLLEKLKGNIRMSEQDENRFLRDSEPPQQNITTAGLIERYDLILENLEELSEIQLIEGKKLLDNSYQMLASSNNTIYLEIALTIVLLLIVISAFSTNKMRPQEES